MAHSPEKIRKHVKFYLGIFGALLVLSVFTVAVSRIHIGPPDSHAGNMIVGLIIATIKASLVALFFMHLSSERRTIYRILVFTVIFVVAMFILFAVAYYDVPMFDFSPRHH